MNIFEFRGVDASSLAGPRRRMELCADLRRQILERQLTAADNVALLNNELDRARLANAFGHDAALQDAVSTGAALAAAMAIRETTAGGRVVVTLGDNAPASFPDGPTGATPPLWLDGLALAVLAGDDEARRCLAAPRVLEAMVTSAAADAAPVGGEPFWIDYGRAWLALLSGDAAAEAHAVQTLEKIAAGPTGPLDPLGLTAIDRPVLDLICRLASGASSDWQGAVQRGVDAFHAYYASDENVHQLTGYLPILLLAVCRIAVERGIGIPPESPYLPASLWRPGAKIGGATVVFDFDRRTVLGADEAHWFLDLQGFSRARREHRLVEKQEELVAQYDAYDGPAIPHARAEFLTVEPHELIAAAGRTIDPPALDAGELLFLAEAFASHPAEGSGADSLRKQRLLLADAAACVDAALMRIPPGFDTVTLGSIVSAEGRKILEQEPGRFRRDRLAAYRDGLVSRLAQLDGAIARRVLRFGIGKATELPPSSCGNEEEARLAAAAAIEVICGQAMPVLQAMGRDAGGEAIAGLQPREDDYEKVFLGNAAEQARNGYRAFWAGKIQMARPSAAQTEIHCAAAPAGMLRHANELSRQFPGGYRAIAPALNPHRVWIAWKYLAPGAQAGLSFDGLVWVDDHWAWFPKPFRVLRGLA